MVPGEGTASGSPAAGCLSGAGGGRARPLSREDLLGMGAGTCRGCCGENGVWAATRHSLEVRWPQRGQFPSGNKERWCPIQPHRGSRLTCSHLPLHQLGSGQHCSLVSAPNLGSVPLGVSCGTSPSVGTRDQAPLRLLLASRAPVGSSPPASGCRMPQGCCGETQGCQHSPERRKNAPRGGNGATWQGAKGHIPFPCPDGEL